MFIKKIHIEDYRSCHNTTFVLDSHLSVLIGPNASGKTTVMSAVLLLRKMLHEESAYYRREQKPTGRCKLNVWFEHEGKQLRLAATIDFYTDEENNDVITSSKQRWYLKNFTGKSKSILFSIGWIPRVVADGRMVDERAMFRHFYHRGLRKIPTFTPNQKEVSILQLVAQYISEMKYYGAAQFTNPSACPVSFGVEKEGERSRGVGLRGHSKFLFDLYSEKKDSTEKSKYNQFFDIIGPLGIHLVDNIKFQEIQTSSIDLSVKSGGKVHKRRVKKNLVIPQFIVGKHELSPNQLSEGTLKTITLLFYLITETSSILLVEEPEVCVHHGLLSSIIELIKTYSAEKQIIVSTHSDSILDKVDAEKVYKVSKTMREGTKVKHITKAMSKQELKALKDYLVHEGNLGEYWKHGALE